MMMVATGVSTTGAFAGGYAMGKSNSQGSGSGGNGDNIFKRNWIGLKDMPFNGKDQSAPLLATIFDFT